MKLQEFKNRFAANQTAFNQLFRRYRIKATGIDGIKEGHERFGEAFLMRAIDILNNHQPGQLSNLEDPKLEEEAYVDDIPFNTTQVVADFNLQNSANQKPGKFWEFFGNLFNAADQAAQSITNVKTAINSNPATPNQEIDASQSKAPNYLLIGAGIAVLILIILLFRQKK